MKDEIKKKVSLLETENKRLKGEVKRLTTWVEVLTQTKQNLQLKIQVLESSIRNFGITIGQDVD
jgi:hypothetical protein